MTRVASIGECMIELSQASGGLLARSYGGDTLNTAVYLARLGVSVDYVTALGDDPWSEEMVRAWEAEGVGTSLVVRVPGRLPGLYVISTDAAGQRTFYYWRDSAPARLLFDLPQTPGIVQALTGYDAVYLSGVSLSLYGEAGRARLFAALDGARACGARVVFDTNFRPRGWPDLALARSAFRAALARADMVLASTEDLEPAVRRGRVGRAADHGPARRGGAQARGARRAHLPWQCRADDRCGAGRGGRRHDCGGRQFCRRLSRRPPPRCGADRRSASGASAGGSRRAPSWGDHPPLGHAGFR